MPAPSSKAFRMDSRDITASQASEIYTRLRDASNYLAALERRMAERQFAADDRRYLEVRAARYSLQVLCQDCTAWLAGRFGTLAANPRCCSFWHHRAKLWPR
jgi:hypothetical protein